MRGKGQVMLFHWLHDVCIHVCPTSGNVYMVGHGDSKLYMYYTRFMHVTVTIALVCEAEV